MSSGVVASPAELLRLTDTGSSLGQVFSTLTTTAVLGSGGHATVYRGFCGVSRQRMAVKVLEDRKHLPRFRGEYRALRLVSSPHVVAVHTYGTTPAPHYVMDLLPGESLERYLQRCGGTVPALEAVGIVRQVCAGLEALHAAGVVHRDLNLSNVIRSPSGHVTIVDLGIARRLPRFYDQLGSITEPSLRAITTSPLGTPGFAAPEVFAGRPATEQADIFALGAVLHVLVTGKTLDLSRDISETIDPRIRTFIADATTIRLSDRYEQARIVSGVLTDLAHELGEQSPVSGTTTDAGVLQVKTTNRLRPALGLLVGFLLPFIWLTNAVLTERATLPEPATEVHTALPEQATEVHTAVPEQATEVPGQATARPEPATTSTDAKPVRQVKARPRRAHTKRKRAEFNQTLHGLLRLCGVAPQRIKYRVRGGKMTLTFANPVNERRKRCLLGGLPTTGRLSGVYKPGKQN